MPRSIYPTRRRNAAGLTLIEVAIATVIVAMLLTFYLNWYTKALNRSKRISCVGRLKQMGISFRGYGIDFGSSPMLLDSSGTTNQESTNSTWHFPMQRSVTNGGALELIASGNVWPIFQVLSNEINNPLILHCPADDTRRPTTSFITLSNANISYFVGLDSMDTMPDTFLAGDTTLMLAGTNLGPGLHVITSNAPPTWSASRHHLQGNILFGDGSVQSFNNARLHTALIYTGLATNRLLFP